MTGDDDAAIEEPELPLLPLRNHVVLPRGQELAPDNNTWIRVLRPRALELLRELRDRPGAKLLLFAQKDSVTEAPRAADFFPIGVEAESLEVRLEEDHGAISVRALRRVRLAEMSAEEPYCMARSMAVDEEAKTADQVATTLAGLRDAAKEYVSLRYRGGPQVEAVHALFDRIDDLGYMADLTASNVIGSFEEQVAILSALDQEERGRLALELVLRQVERKRRLDLRAGADLRQVWPLEAGADSRIAQAVSKGAMTTAEGEHLREFSAKGYTVLEKVIEPATIDALLRDIQCIPEYPGHFATTDHRHGQSFALSDHRFDAFESIYDLYANFESARRVCFHPAVLRMLELIFEARPVAFQQLLFQRSNQHPLHQDTAYVCVEEPLWIVGSWIALEDVVAGRGELTYLEGSHRIPHLLYHDGTKRFDPEHDDETTTRQALLDRCTEHGCPQRDFLAKKGDVLLWAADLVHGSKPRTAPLEETRLSCVTHYCPDTTAPLFFMNLPQHRQLQPYGERAAFASSHYRYPQSEKFARAHLMSPLPS